MKKITDTSPFTNPFNSMEDTNWINEVEARYLFEDQLLSFITKGDTKAALDLWNTHNPNGMNEFNYLPSDNPLEPARRNCRIANVTFRIAARMGGLTPIYLHNLSEKFCVIIMNTTQIDTLRYHLIPTMLSEYSDAVANFSTFGYSRLIDKTVHYITCHLTEKLQVSDIASLLFVSPEHLSRRFHQETGMTVSDYTNHHRIALSKIYLEQGHANLAEIASRVGYRDSSYFSKVFKNICGISPSQYRMCNEKNVQQSVFSENKSALSQ